MLSYALLMLGLLSYASSVSAGPVRLQHFPWTLNDISEQDLTKEELFRSMPRKIFANGSAICANKAQMWSWHFKQKHDVDTGKVFLFFTEKFKRWGGWWYHVAPIINEGGVEYVMDGGFGSIKKPLLVDDWIRHWQKNFKCYEITPNDKDLLELMHQGAIFPSTTHRGTWSCYTMKTPAGYWWPASIATQLLGFDATGNPAQEHGDELKKDEVYSACREAVTGPLRSVLGMGEGKCREFVGGM